MISKKIKNPRQAVFGLLIVILLAIFLAFYSNRFESVAGGISFFLVLAFCASLLLLAWKSIEGDAAPNWLWVLLLGAALLRLGLGAFWMEALPAWGYDTPVQEAGYVMEDAFNRDVVAWDLAQSDLPLINAFQGFSSRDQYGGLLMLSAGIYRYSGASDHQALLTIVLAATVSAIAVIFVWAFSKVLWGEKLAQIAAWGLALYPEALLLGSSQMREAFSVTLTVLSLYALVKFRNGPSRNKGLFLALPLTLALALSPPFSFSLFILLALVALPLYEWKFFSRLRYWLPFTSLVIIALIVFLNSSANLWIVQSAEWQAYISRNASGWVARQFDRMPLWGQIPFLLSYGVFRPLLPAAIFADGVVIWRAVAIWRALGWTLVLAMLFYASSLAIRQKVVTKLPGILLASNWGFILIASYRGGGDLWDSPRYRSAFAGIQILLVAWAWMQQRESKDPWLKRAIVGTGMMMAWFAPWYLRRYADFEWPVVELHHVIGLGLASAALYAIWDWLSA